MNDHAITSAVSIALALIGVAIVAVIVSPNGKTASVLGGAAGAIKTVLCVATSPVTGSKNCVSALSNIASGVNFGCTTVEGVQYCP